MSVGIVTTVTAEDCASNYGIFEVEGSSGDTYTVSFAGSEGPAHCTCQGFKFRGDCKHVKAVYDGACLYNPQWHDAKEDPTYRPVDYGYANFSKSKCVCGDKMVYVKRVY